MLEFYQANQMAVTLMIFTLFFSIVTVVIVRAMHKGFATAFDEHSLMPRLVDAETNLMREQQEHKFTRQHDEKEMAIRDKIIDRYTFERRMPNNNGKYNHLMSDIPNTPVFHGIVDLLNKKMKESKSRHSLSRRYRKPKGGMQYGPGGGVNKKDATTFSVYIKTL